MDEQRLIRKNGRIQILQGFHDRIPDGGPDRSYPNPVGERLRKTKSRGIAQNGCRAAFPIPSDAIGCGSAKKARFRAVKRWTTAWPISPVRLPASIPTTHLPRRRRVPGLKKRRIPPPVLQESGHGSFLRKKSGFQKTDLLVPGFFRLQPTQEASGSVKVVVGFDDPCSLNPAGYSPPPCSDGDHRSKEESAVTGLSFQKMAAG